MRRNATSRLRERAGFTLIETLVALVTLAVVMLVAQRGIVATRIGLDRAQSTLAAEAVARSILETELDRLAALPGTRTGVTDGLDWSVSAELLPLPPPPPPKTETRTPNPDPAQAREAASPAGQDSQPGETDVRWIALRVYVTVANGRGRPLTLETVHLAKAPS